MAQLQFPFSAADVRDDLARIISERDEARAAEQRALRDVEVLRGQLAVAVAIAQTVVGRRISVEEMGSVVGHVREDPVFATQESGAGLSQASNAQPLPVPPPQPPRPPPAETPEQIGPVPAVVLDCNPRASAPREATHDSPGSPGQALHQPNESPSFAPSTVCPLSCQGASPCGIGGNHGPSAMTPATTSPPEPPRSMPSTATLMPSLLRGKGYGFTDGQPALPGAGFQFARGGGSSFSSSQTTTCTSSTLPAAESDDIKPQQAFAYQAHRGPWAAQEGDSSCSSSQATTCTGSALPAADGDEARAARGRARQSCYGQHTTAGRFTRISSMSAVVVTPKSAAPPSMRSLSTPNEGARSVPAPSAPLQMQPDVALQTFTPNACQRGVMGGHLASMATPQPSEVLLESSEDHHGARASLPQRSHFSPIGVTRQAAVPLQVSTTEIAGQELVTPLSTCRPVLPCPGSPLLAPYCIPLVRPRSHSESPHPVGASLDEFVGVPSQGRPQTMHSTALIGAGHDSQLLAHRVMPVHITEPSMRRGCRTPSPVIATSPASTLQSPIMTSRSPILTSRSPILTSRGIVQEVQLGTRSVLGSISPRTPVLHPRASSPQEYATAHARWTASHQSLPSSCTTPAVAFRSPQQRQRTPSPPPAHVANAGVACDLQMSASPFGYASRAPTRSSETTSRRFVPMAMATPHVNHAARDQEEQIVASSSPSSALPRTCSPQQSLGFVPSRLLVSLQAQQRLHDRRHRQCHHHVCRHLAHRRLLRTLRRYCQCALHHQCCSKRQLCLQQHHPLPHLKAMPLADSARPPLPRRSQEVAMVVHLVLAVGTLCTGVPISSPAPA